MVPSCSNSSFGLSGDSPRLVTWQTKWQRRSARFITGDYTSRTPGSMTKILNSLQLPTLQQRRKDLRLISLYKVVEGLVPAIPPAAHLTPHKPGRLIKPKQYTDCNTTSAIEDHIRNNKRSFEVKRCNTDQLKNSFFISAVRDWNHLEQTTVTAPSVEIFKKRINYKMWTARLGIPHPLR